jgi:hypothetical protein
LLPRLTPVLSILLAFCSRRRKDEITPGILILQTKLCIVYPPLEPFFFISLAAIVLAVLNRPDAIFPRRCRQEIGDRVGRRQLGYETPCANFSFAQLNDLERRPNFLKMSAEAVCYHWGSASSQGTESLLNRIADGQGVQRDS